MGCGSIGTRHAKNLSSLGIRNLILCDTNKTRLKILGNIINSKLQYTDYVMAVKENPDVAAVIICTPSSMHVDAAIFFAKKKINLFIEKPLSNNLTRTSALSQIVQNNELIVMMGHAFLFDKGFKTVKRLLDKKIIGKIYSVTYFQGQYLPDWHPNRDYTNEYTARKNLGGGVLLTLTSHTLYILEWLFGKTQIHGKLASKISNLKVDVEDCVFLLLKTNDEIIIQTQNNFISKIHVHKILIDGEKGQIEYDVLQKRIKIINSNKSIRNMMIKSDYNDRFKEEMKYFLKCLRTGNVDDNVDLHSGIRFLKFAKNISGKNPR